jgi:ribosomal protein S18 acetylase RimI-like enzyme
MPVVPAELDHLAHPVVAAFLTRQREHAEVVERGDAVAARTTLKLAPITGFWAPRREEALAALGELLARHPVALVISYDEAEQAALASRFGAAPIYAPLQQMVFEGRPAGAWPSGPADPPVAELGAADYPAMQALVDIAQPGPFGEESLRIGRFIGVRDGAQLVAMGGLRTQSDRVAELTAISTRPEARGRGLAARIVATLVDDLLAEGRTPYLHVAVTNATAIRVYERLGFRPRRRARLMLIQPSPPSSSEAFSRGGRA